MKALPTAAPITEAELAAAQRALFDLLDRWHIEDGSTAEQYRAKVAEARARLAQVKAMLVPLAEAA